MFLLLLGLAALQDAPAPDAGSGRDPRVFVGSVDFTTDEVDRILEHSPLPDPPPDPTNRVYESEAAARLGQALFYDVDLSETGTIACATCHVPEQGWSDGQQLGEGVVTLDRHSMTLWNVAYNRWYFWDGRRDTLWAQALTPIEDEREHRFSRLGVAHLLFGDPAYRRAYEEVFGPMPELSAEERFPAAGRPVDDPTHPHAIAWAGMRIADQEAVNDVFVNAGKSIAAFQRLIVSRDAPFDTFVTGLREGDATKQRYLKESAKRGLRLFLDRARCHLCHTGPNFTDMEFHNDRIPPLEGGVETDLGRFAGIQKVEQDPFNGIGRYSDDPDGAARTKVDYLLKNSHNVNEFKTPSLRNVAVTAPYMHNGRFASLGEVIDFYSTLEGALPQHKGRERLLVAVHLSPQEKEDLQDFLESLTDTKIAEELKAPPPTPYLED